MSDRHPLWELVYAVEMDHRALGAKLQELRAQLANLNLPEPERLACPVCGIKTRGPRTLAEHLYQSHDGETPESWEAIDKLTV